MKYKMTAKNVRLFDGLDFNGYQFDLYLNGTKTAWVSDTGDGIWQIQVTIYPGREELWDAFEEYADSLPAAGAYGGYWEVLCAILMDRFAAKRDTCPPYLLLENKGVLHRLRFNKRFTKKDLPELEKVVAKKYPTAVVLSYKPVFLEV